MKTYHISFADAIDYTGMKIMLCNNAIDLLNEDEQCELMEYLYNPETDSTDDVYQTYITDAMPSDTVWVKKFIPSLPIVYCEKLDMYLMFVTHWGTSWDYVGINVKVDEDNDYMNNRMKQYEKDFEEKFNR